MRPTIGITTSVKREIEDAEHLRIYLNAAYADAIYEAGGLPLLIPPPPTPDPLWFDEILDRVDAVLFTGGHDLHPRHYRQTAHAKTEPMHERRGQFEVEFFRRADSRKTPVLAICLGQQVANVARGGSLIQHIGDQTTAVVADGRQAAANIEHQDSSAETPVHAAEIRRDSRLATIIRASTVEVNSRHHQAVDPAALGAGLRPVAFAPDGVIEAIEATDDRFLIGVQWHPEDMTGRAEHRALFAALVAAARQTCESRLSRRISHAAATNQ